MKNKVILQEVRNEKEILTEYEAMKQMKSNNVVKERVEFYRDFVINLIHYIHSTYLGKDYIKTEEDIRGHFNWAFNKVLADLEAEEIIFGDTKEIREYYFKYFHVRLYEVDATPSLKAFLNFWEEIFALKPNKEKTVMNALIEVYKMFDDAFTSKKIILDKVL